MKISFQTCRPGAVLPRRGSAQAAGLDLCACLDAPLTILPGEIAMAPTGLRVELPAGTVGLLCGRSGLGVRYGITLANNVGVIDADYRGEIQVWLINLGKAPYTLMPGERCAQLLVVPVHFPQPQFAETLSDTARGEAGFGSTGRM